MRSVVTDPYFLKQKLKSNFCVKKKKKIKEGLSLSFKHFKRIIRKHYEKLYANKSGNLDNWTNSLTDKNYQN